MNFWLSLVVQVQVPLPGISTPSKVSRKDLEITLFPCCFLSAKFALKHCSLKIDALMHWITYVGTVGYRISLGDSH